MLYTQALNGPFALDDQPNFYGLQFVNDFKSALAYAYNGPAGIRWLSYLSFTFPIELQGWKQSNAHSFKAINVAIHIFNGILIFYVTKNLLSLSAQSQQKKQALILACCISCLWFIHPIHVNTVLYSVQRMTLLSSTFVLIGIIYHLYFIGKNPIYCSPVKWLQYSAILAGITILGILCKESAVLLPAMVWTTFLLTPNQTFNRWQKFITFALPYISLLALLIALNRLTYSYREFTLTERLLSEVVILKEYIEKIYLPSFNSFSLYYDDFNIVEHFSELAFIVSFLFLTTFLTLCVYFNRFGYGLGFASAWFFMGHSLESTIIPLELYFDHRNYLPSLGLITGLVLVIHFLLYSQTKKFIQIMITLLALAIGSKFLWHSINETTYWRSDAQLAHSSIIKHPNSMRANQHYIETLANQGRFAEAAALVEKTYEQFGPKISNILFQIAFACMANANAQIKSQELASDLQSMEADNSISDAMDYLLNISNEKHCDSINWQTYDQFTVALLSNPNLSIHYHNLVFLHMRSYLLRQQPEQALNASYQLNAEHYTPPFLFLQLHIAIDIRNFAAAKNIMHHIDSLNRRDKLLYQHDIERIKQAYRHHENEKSN